MKTRRDYGRWSLGLAVALGATAVAGSSVAAPTERFSENLRGGAVAFGTTMGWDCGASSPQPAADCIAEGLTGADTSPDVYWNDAIPAAGPLVGPGAARTTIGVALPGAATVQRAFLYWSARAPAADDTVTFEKVGGASAPVTAEAANIVTTGSFFQAVADVTAQVQAGGAGAWRLTGLDAGPAAITDEDILYSAWSLVIVYADPTLPVNRVRIYDGLDLVDANATLSVTVTGGTPNVSTPAGTLTVLAYDGDFDTTGDSVSWNGAPLTDAQNPADNFFNSTRSRLGAGFFDGADVPGLLGTPDTVASLDLDVVDLGAGLTAGEGAATVEIAAGDDAVLLGALITQAVGCGADTDCAAGEACDEATGNCATTCRSDADCDEPTPKCDVDGGGLCVECLADTDCDAGETCNTTSHVCEGGGVGGAGGAGGGGGSSSGGAGVGGAGTGGTAPSTGAGVTPPGDQNDFTGLAAEGGACALSPGGSAQQTALLVGALGAIAGLLARRRRRS